MNCFRFYIKLLWHHFCLLLLTVIVVSCGSDKPATDDDIIILPDDNYSYNDDYDRECGTRGCRRVEFFYEITRIFRLDGATDIPEDANYVEFLAVIWQEFEWEVEFVPEDGASSPQVRFVVNEDDLPYGITLKNTSSKRLTFNVDLKLDTIKDELNDLSDPYDDDIDGIKVIDPDKDGNDLEYNADEWLRVHDRGYIDVEVHDISYCQWQNNKNRDTTSNQVDCNDKDTEDSYFRPEIIRIPYRIIIPNDAKLQRWRQATCKGADIGAAVFGKELPWIESLVNLIGEVAFKSKCYQDNNRSRR